MVFSAMINCNDAISLYSQFIFTDSFYKPISVTSLSRSSRGRGVPSLAVGQRQP